MSLLREILEEAFLLREDASVDAINSAVNNMHPAVITYNGPSGNGNGPRTIYPVAYGLSTAGNPVVRAFQPQGSTSTEVPAWKFFRIDRIASWKNDNSRTFNPAELNGFNEDGDEQIETLYAISPIGGAEVEKQPKKQTEPEKPEKVLTGHPVRKGEVDNGGADKNTERQYYTANDAVRDILNTSNPKIGQENNKNIDKVAGQDYNAKETQPVRDALPVTKTELDGPGAATEPAERNPDLYGNEGPVMKTDLTPKPETLAGNFKDMSDRMNGLYNDEEEEDNAIK